jgi:fucose 4-O-acetylase-like acetyltransferase
MCSGISLLVLEMMRGMPPFLARIGQRSLYVFLWHGLPLIMLQQAGILRAVFAYQDGSAMAMALLLTAAIVYLCAHRWCAHITERVLLLPLTRLLLGR